MEPRIFPLGDCALVVEFGEKMDAGINRQAQRLAEALRREPVDGLGEAVPTYRSVLVHYDPLKLDYAAVERIARERMVTDGAEAAEERAAIEIPVIYGGEHGPDLEELARLHGLTPEQVVELHTRREYRVYMIGFTPGFPYLGEVDEAIATPRLESPRTRVPAGSVGIAGRQTGIYPIESPGGWRLIGFTPVKLFDLDQDPPSLLSPGDIVRFVRLDHPGGA